MLQKNNDHKALSMGKQKAAAKAGWLNIIGITQLFSPFLMYVLIFYERFAKYIGALNIKMSNAMLQQK